MSGFKRFTQDFEDMAVEFGQFVKKQDTMMCERYFAGARYAAATDERDGGCRVMRCTERPDFPLCRTECAGNGTDGSRFHGFLFRHGRQYADKTGGQHRFAGAGRATHQNAVAACGGDFQRSLGLLLAFDFAEIGILRCVCGGCFGKRMQNRLCRIRIEVRADIEQCVGWQYRKAGNETGFRCIVARYDESMVWHVRL